jgi:hypothetical protein
MAEERKKAVIPFNIIPLFRQRSFIVHATSCVVWKNEMGVACSTYGGEGRCIQGIGGETRGKETTWKT